MRTRQTQGTAWKGSLSTLEVAQDSWDFVAKALRGRKGVGLSLVLRELRENGIFSKLTCGSKAAFEWDSLNPCPTQDPSSCWANLPGTQRAFFFHPPTPLSGSPITCTSVCFFLQNLATKLSLDTRFFLSAGWQTNKYRVIILILLKYKHLSMIRKLIPRFLHFKVNSDHLLSARCTIKGDFYFRLHAFLYFPNE